MDPNLERHVIPYYKNFYLWVTSNPNTQPMLYAFIKRKEFIPDKKIWQRVKSSMEHGMFQRMIWTAEASDITLSFIIKIDKRPTQMRGCKEYTRKHKIKEVEFQALKVVNFKKFTLVYLALISVCCIAYILEVVFKDLLKSIRCDI